MSLGGSSLFSHHKKWRNKEDNNIDDMRSTLEHFLVQTCHKKNGLVWITVVAERWRDEKKEEEEEEEDRRVCGGAEWRKGGLGELVIVAA